MTDFNLGSKIFSSNVFYAPLAGCSDYAFRQMSAKYRPGLMYCEMVKMEALVRREPNTLKMLDYAASMRPIGGQICGSNPAIAAEAAKIIEDLGFDVLDLNCGCPVDKITKDGSGSAMLKTPERIGETISNMVAAVRIPVTVKIRAGWDDNSINAAQITQIAEAAGAQAICIHGRTREQAYRGPANWDHIKACKQVAKNIKVIGNGDITGPIAAKKMFEHTGCDAILVARGTMGKPWAVEEILNYFSTGILLERTFEERRNALLEHFQYITDYCPPVRALLDMRRVGCWYLKSAPGCRAFRGQISKAETLDQVRDLIMQFSFEEDEEQSSETQQDI